MGWWSKSLRHILLELLEYFDFEIISEIIWFIYQAQPISGKEHFFFFFMVKVLTCFSPPVRDLENSTGFQSDLKVTSLVHGIIFSVKGPRKRAFFHAPLNHVRILKYFLNLSWICDIPTPKLGTLPITDQSPRVCAIIQRKSRLFPES